jgi:hypothetical protein
MAGALFGDTFPSPGSGGSQDLTGTSDPSDYAMGTHFRVGTACTVNAIRWFVPSGVAPSNTDFAVGLFKVDATNGIGGTVTSLDWNTGVTRPGSGAQGTWITLPLSSPVALSSGDEVYAVVRTNRYAFSAKVFSGITTVPGVDSRISYVGDGVGGVGFPNGAFVTGGSQTPNPPSWAGNATSFNATFYGVDVELASSSTNATATPSTVAPPAVTIGTPNLLKGTTATPSLVAPPAVSIPTPTIGTGSSAKATPALVQAAVSIPTPTIIVPLSATATPARVNGAVSVPRPLIFAGVQWSRWDGLHETVLTLDGVWNGVGIDPLTFDQVTP